MEASSVVAAVIEKWADIVTALSALAALILSIVSLRVATAAQHLAESQERRKAPRLVIHLRNGYSSTRSDGSRDFTFQVEVRNPTDSDNAIARAEMHLRYIVGDATPITLKLPSNKRHTQDHDERNKLLPPCRIAAHDVHVAWVQFSVLPEMLNGRAIDKYWLVITDSHQAEVTLETSILREEHNAT
jgi:hypothetical protein